MKVLTFNAVHQFLQQFFSSQRKASKHDIEFDLFWDYSEMTFHFGEAETIFHCLLGLLGSSKTTSPLLKTGPLPMSPFKEIKIILFELP